MKKKIATGMVMLVLGLSSGPLIGQVLGLGSISTESALNQPLSASIPVDNVPDDLEVRIAPDFAFERLGLERSVLPADLVLEVINGVIVIRTEQPVFEPYLPILIEAEWAGGRFIREYAVLLDPPTGLGQDTPDVQLGGVAPASPSDRSEPLGGTYQVRQGDTLYAIVQRWGYDARSVAQAAVAVARANPEGFVDGNPNRLRSGVTLNRPEADLVATITADEAQRILRGEAPPTPPAAVLPEPEAIVVAEVPEDVTPAEDVVAGEVEPTPVPDDVADAPPALDETAQDADGGPAERIDDRLEIAALDEDAAALVELERQAVREIELEAAREQAAQANAEREEIARLLAVANADLARLEDALRDNRVEQSDLQAQIDALRAQVDRPALERFLSDPIMMMLAGSTLLLFLLLLLSIARGRGRDPAPAATAPPAPNDAANRGTGAVGGVTGAALATAATAADNERDDQRNEEFEHLAAPVEPETSEMAARSVVDVLAEVDVYLAYGMEPQALEALETAVADHPDDPDLQLRRVDTLIALQRDAEAGAALAAVRGLVSADDPRLLEREQRLSGGEFSAMAATALESGDVGSHGFAAGGEADLTDAFGDDPETFADRTRSGADDATGVNPSADDATSLEFDPASDASQHTFVSGSLPRSPEANDATAIEFESVVGNDAANVDSDDEVDLSDQNLDDVDADALLRDADAADDTTGADGNDDGRNANADSAATLPAEEPVAEPTSVSDTDGPDAEIDEAEAERRTKLELARVYADMEDPEGALELLDELLQTASGPLAKEAQALRSKLRSSGS